MDFDVTVEIPKGQRNKYEVDHATGRIRLDRTLFTSTQYPADYGYIEGTLGQDEDPLDALVLVQSPTFPGCLIRVRLIGVLTIEDDEGVKEPKLLAVPVEEPRFAEYADIKDVPAHLLKEIENFFDIYKQLEGDPVKARGWQGARQAEKVLEEAIA